MRRSLGVAAAFTAAIWVLALSASPASASVRGAWRWPGSYGQPAWCLTVGTLINSTYSPDHHEVSGLNSCVTTDSVESILFVCHNSSCSSYNECDSGTQSDYAQCGLNLATNGNDYWEYRASITDSSNNTATFYCDNQGRSYGSCFDSSD